MGHLPIVNQETVQRAIEEGHVGTRGSLGPRWVKTVADLFSDALATRPGDWVFPWIVKGGGGANLGFKYAFRVAGEPFIARGQEYPIKVPLEPEGYAFEIPVREEEALSLWGRRLLWNAIGKKSLRRGRSLTPQTPWEDDRLLEMLRDRNPSGPKAIELGDRDFTASIPLTIDTSVTSTSFDREEGLGQLDPTKVAWREGDQFTVEKAFEAWVMENLDGPAGEDLRRLAFGALGVPDWFSNYLPYGVQGSNIDVVAIHVVGEDDAIATVIELKKGGLNRSGFESAAHQAIDYSDHIENALEAYGFSTEVRPIVLSGEKSTTPETRPVVVRDGREVRWITYEIEADGAVRFTEL